MSIKRYMNKETGVPIHVRILFSLKKNKSWESQEWGQCYTSSYWTKEARFIKTKTQEKYTPAFMPLCSVGHI